jgi:hypothetical protein
MRFLTHRLRNLSAAALLLVPAAVPKISTPAAKAPAPPQGKIDIRLLVTADPDKVFHPKKGADGKFDNAEPIKIAPRGKLLGGVVFFKNCRADATGKCNVDVDLQGIAPGGLVFENRKGAELWRAKKAPHPDFTQLGSPYMKIQIEPKDPAGVYRVIAVAHDRVSGLEARSEATFEVK